MSDLLDQLKLAVPGRYEIERLLGSGGMATVYLARDRQYNRRVAIKVLRAELAGAVGQDRFLREIRIASELNHPHILPLLDSGTAEVNGDTLPFYVMPFVEGESLRDRLNREKQLPIDETIAIARDIAAALQHAHSHKIIHRDIKPENILLTGHEAVVADFGIARAIDRSADKDVLTTIGVAIGTAAYMSPEQASAQAELDGRTDVYSLGCVVYEMLGGDPPFTGSSANAVAARHRVDMVPPLRTIRPSVPPFMEAAVLRALEKIPADRFNTAEQFAAALSHHPSPTAPARPGFFRPRSSRPAPAPPVGVAAPRPPRQRAFIAGGSLLLLAGLVIIGWLTLRPEASRRYPENPAWSPWRGWKGEYFPLVATTDSLLVTMPLGGRAAQVFDGRSWTTLAIPDSFQLLRHVGQIPDRRLLAIKPARDSAGLPVRQYWWMSVSPDGLRPLEPIEGLLPDEGMLPLWWSDGDSLLLWLDAIRKPAGGAWVREPTGTSGFIKSLWGRDVQHRFAIPTSGDSLLVFDGVNWKLVDILGAPPGRYPSYRAGGTFGDGATVVLGDECLDEVRCRPLLIEQTTASGPWQRVPFPEGAGLPLKFTGDTAIQCDPGGFSLTDVAGRSHADYFVWGSWSTCDPAWSMPESIGCPPLQPCFWHVTDGKVEPVTELRGRVIQTVVYMDTSAYALLNDGTLWQRTGQHFRVVTQVPDLEPRMVGASPRMLVRFDGGYLRYEPGYGDIGPRFDVLAMTGVPPDVTWATPPRMLVVRDTAAALLTAGGAVFVSRCRRQRLVNTPPAGLRCPALVELPVPAGPIDAIGFLTDGRLIGVGPRGTVITWRDSLAEVELLPAEARRDSLRGIVTFGQDQAIAIGSTRMFQRDSAGRWSTVRRIWSGPLMSHFVYLPDGDIVVVERSIHVFDRSADSLPVAVLYRPDQGEPPVAAIHGLPDGRLVGGLVNPEEPTLRGRLMVWATPARANRSQEVRLPISVDITDLADDGRYLYVVGRGGSLKIPLDSLPFSKTPVH